MARRQHLTLIVILGVVAFLSLTWLMSSNSASGTDAPFSPASFTYESAKGDKAASGQSADFGLPSSVLTGGAIAPKLGNETAKAELGRATWKLLHTMMARFPEEPTSDDSLALKTYITLFARLYPCGECAAHFQKFLAKYPPQTSSRNAAAGWACFMHNKVNERLKKPLFDCNKIGDFYDCGCAEDKGKKITLPGSPAAAGESELKGREGKREEPATSLSLEKEEGLARGG